MTDIIVNSGLKFFEDVLFDQLYTETLNTVAVGDGEVAPSKSDTSLTNNLYEANSAAANVTVSRGSGIGEMVFTIEVTGGTEVPAGAELTEVAVKSSDGQLVYYEVRSTAITVATGETKILEVRITPDTATEEVESVITNGGAEVAAEIAIGNTSEKIDTIAIGDSINSVSETDSSMFSEIYRADQSTSQVTMQSTTNVGEPDILITVSAGSDFDDEVAGGSDISEFGLISGDTNTLYFHETRNTVTLEANDAKVFNIPSKIVQ